MFFGHSISNGAKFLRLGHDPSQNVVRIYQVFIIDMIMQKTSA